MWVIQHARNVAEVIDRISRTLKPDGLLYALNERTRSVPTNHGWIDYGFDIRAALCRALSEESIHALPEHVSEAAPRRVRPTVLVIDAIRCLAIRAGRAGSTENVVT